MPTGLKRYHQSEQFHFITFSCYRRKPLLQNPEAKDTLERILEQVREKQDLKLVAYVLMPEHVHLLTDEPGQGTIATFLQILKQRSSHALKSTGSDQFWQRRYFDRNVRTHDETIEKVNYIHRNPVKRALVTRPEHYLWSSARLYASVSPGTIRIARI